MTPSASATFRDSLRTSAVFLLFLEAVSFYGHLYPAFSNAAFFAAMALALVISCVDLDLAALLVMAELFVGSQGGYLVAFNNGHGLELSLRIGLFMVVSGVWTAVSILWSIQGGEALKKALAPWRAMHRFGIFVPYVAINLVVLFGLIRGLALGNDFGNVFFDGNGYAFYGLMPVFVVALASPKTRERVAGLLVAAVSLSVAKALLVLYVFSHRMQTAAPDLYTWIRDTRVGEITRMAGDYYRVFFQSHLYAAALFWIVLLGLAYSDRLKTGRAKMYAGLTVICMVGLILGLSRSFWFGAAVSALALAAILLRYRVSIKIWKRLIAAGALSIVAATMLIVLFFSLPLPRKGADISLAFLLGERAFSLSDDAAHSRWALLPELNKAITRHPLIGSGLGTTVTYATSDPRLLADIPTGEYTTFAFEWGYHDILVKFGLLGTLVYAWFIFAALRPLMSAVRDAAPALRSPSSDEKTALGAAALGTVIAVIGMLATNLFSPYLNHPLGIGMLMIAASLGIHGAFSSGVSSSTDPSKSG
ncbi:MAG: O-antigen ligase family protein [Patescibacteria group bacterium]